MNLILVCITETIIDHSDRSSNIEALWWAMGQSVVWLKRCRSLKILTHEVEMLLIKQFILVVSAVPILHG